MVKDTKSMIIWVYAIMIPFCVQGISLTPSHQNKLNNAHAIIASPSYASVISIIQNLINSRSRFGLTQKDRKYVVDLINKASIDELIEYHSCSNATGNVFFDICLNPYPEILKAVLEKLKNHKDFTALLYQKCNGKMTLLAMLIECAIPFPQFKAQWQEMCLLLLSYDPSHTLINTLDNYNTSPIYKALGVNDIDQNLLMTLAVHTNLDTIINPGLEHSCLWQAYPNKTIFNILIKKLVDPTLSNFKKKKVQEFLNTSFSYKQYSVSLLFLLVASKNFNEDFILDILPYMYPNTIMGKAFDYYSCPLVVALGKSTSIFTALLSKLSVNDLARSDKTGTTLLSTLLTQAQNSLNVTMQAFLVDALNNFIKTPGQKFNALAPNEYNFTGSVAGKLFNIIILSSLLQNASVNPQDTLIIKIIDLLSTLVTKMKPADMFIYRNLYTITGQVGEGQNNSVNNALAKLLMNMINTTLLSIDPLLKNIPSNKVSDFVQNHLMNISQSLDFGSDLAGTMDLSTILALKNSADAFNKALNASSLGKDLQAAITQFNNQIDQDDGN